MFSRNRSSLIMLAGLAGGFAEVLWVSLYSMMFHTGGTEISRQITATVIPPLAQYAIAPSLGIIIHLILSVLLASGFYLLVANSLVRYFGQPGLVLGSGTVLAAVWLVNFFIILPIINPYFLGMLPLAVTLISKLLFGMAMAIVLLNGLEKRAINSYSA